MEKGTNNNYQMSIWPISLPNKCRKFSKDNFPFLQGISIQLPHKPLIFLYTLFFFILCQVKVNLSYIDEFLKISVDLFRSENIFWNHCA